MAVSIKTKLESVSVLRQGYLAEDCEKRVFIRLVETKLENSIILTQWLIVIRPQIALILI